MSNARRIVEKFGFDSSVTRSDLQHRIAGVMEVVEDVNLAECTDGGDALLLLPRGLLVSDEVDI